MTLLNAQDHKGELVYEGKAKRLFSVKGRDDLIWQEFKDSLTAFNALKKGEFENKGPLNRDITSLIFRYLQKKGIVTHWVQDIGTREMVTSKLKMLKLEVVIRNVLAGSTAKKFDFPEGTLLEKPLLEFFYKDDALGDPFISDEQALMLKVASAQSELDRVKEKAYVINLALLTLFSEVGIDLIDFKIELGLNQQGEVILADEITPDSCRLWDHLSKEKMDKDRFRRDLGSIKENYEKVFALLKQRWESSL
jgi:phosphoribosylaminoimidazole-succinocarboxamide synthase